MNGVLDALKHSYLLSVRKWGDGSNSAIFYLSILLYRNAISSVKKKIRNLYKKQNVIMRQNYFL